MGTDPRQIGGDGVITFHRAIVRHLDQCERQVLYQVDDTVAYSSATASTGLKRNATRHDDGVADDRVHREHGRVVGCCSAGGMPPRC